LLPCVDISGAFYDVFDVFMICFFIFSENSQKVNEFLTLLPPRIIELKRDVSELPPVATNSMCFVYIVYIPDYSKVHALQ